MALYMATINVLVDVDGEAEACDCMAEALRPILKEFAPLSSVIDWHYADGGDPAPHDGTGFEYADSFKADQCEDWPSCACGRGGPDHCKTEEGR